MKNYYVAKPDLTPYEGIKVTKDTNLTFENENVKQEIKDLKLKSTSIFETEKSDYEALNLALRGDDNDTKRDESICS